MKDDLVMRAQLGAPYDHSVLDANFNRLMYFTTGNWVAGSYQANEVVHHRGGWWVAIADTTEEPIATIPASGDWRPLNMVPGRGGMNLSAPTASATLGAAFVTVPVDQEAVAPYGMTQDLVLSEFAFTFAGLWQININLFFSHDSSNSGRSVVVRLFDVTDGAPVSGGVPVGIGRNVGDSFIAVSILTSIDASFLGDNLRLEIGGGDTLNDFVITTASVESIQMGVV